MFRPMRNAVVLLVFVLTATPSLADTAAAWAALRAGKAVALIRHADAPGIGDPAGYKLEDCSTQRNLSERGRVQAAALGALFRANQIEAKILSSPWCRCLETARLMNLGPVAVDSSFSNAFVLADQREELKRRGSVVISAWKGGNLIIMTHGNNIAALSGQQLAPAETLVVEPGTVPVRVIGRIPSPN
jgi:phosphohistidine phosphatase SixA